jgi:hypothetical protein
LSPAEECYCRRRYTAGACPSAGPHGLKSFLRIALRILRPAALGFAFELLPLFFGVAKGVLHGEGPAGVVGGHEVVGGHADRGGTGGREEDGRGRGDVQVASC